MKKKTFKYYSDMLDYILEYTGKKAFKKGKVVTIYCDADMAIELDEIYSGMKFECYQTVFAVGLNEYIVQVSEKNFIIEPRTNSDCYTDYLIVIEDTLDGYIEKLDKFIVEDKIKLVDFEIYSEEDYADCCNCENCNGCKEEAKEYYNLEDETDKKVCVCPECKAQDELLKELLEDFRQDDCTCDECMLSLMNRVYDIAKQDGINSFLLSLQDSINEYLN